MERHRPGGTRWYPSVYRGGSPCSRSPLIFVTAVIIATFISRVTAACTKIWSSSSGVGQRRFPSSFVHHTSRTCFESRLSPAFLQTKKASFRNPKQSTIPQTFWPSHYLDEAMKERFRYQQPVIFTVGLPRNTAEIGKRKLPTNVMAITGKFDEGTESAEIEQDFFISEALFVHMGPVARILTEEFYSYRTNFITFQIERLKTSLSLESTFPKGDTDLSRRKMFVACRKTDGKVVGFAEVDTRRLQNEENVSEAQTQSEDDIDGSNTLKMYENKSDEDLTVSRQGASNEIPRPYMYNLAVDKTWKRKGIATALVGACEDFVIDFCGRQMKHVGSEVESRLFLRVRKSNAAALSLYSKMGYLEIDPSSLALSYEDINSGSMEEGELVLLAKDLSTEVKKCSNMEVK